MLVSEILRIKGTTLYTTPPEAPVLEAVKVMAQNDIGSLVVMDHGRMAGIVTFAEVLRALADRGGTLGDLTISAITERDPLTATPSIDVNELRRTMLERHARYVPVMDGTTLLGVVSFHDVAKAVLEEQSFENQMLKSYIQDSPAVARRHVRARRGTRRLRARVADARPAARISPAASRRRAPSAPRHSRIDFDTIDSVGSVRSAATHRRVAGLHDAASAASSAALR